MHSINGKGSADTRSPDFPARRDGWGRIYGDRHEAVIKKAMSDGWAFFDGALLPPPETPEATQCLRWVSVKYMGREIHVPLECLMRKYKEEEEN